MVLTVISVGACIITVGASRRRSANNNPMNCIYTHIQLHKYINVTQ